MSGKVEIANLSKERIDEDFLKRIAMAVKKMINGKEIGDISLVLVSEEKIQEINKKYRRKDRPTDILSFEKLNEIFICPQAIKKQAKNLRIPFKEELTRVLVHGILHLAGYEHESNKKEAKKMKKMEDRILNHNF